MRPIDLCAEHFEQLVPGRMVCQLATHHQNYSLWNRRRRRGPFWNRPLEGMTDQQQVAISRSCRPDREPAINYTGFQQLARPLRACRLNAAGEPGAGRQPGQQHNQLRS